MSDGNIPGWIDALEELGLVFDLPPDRPVLGEDKQSRDAHRIPVESFERDPAGEAQLDVVAAECLLDGGDLRFELDDE